MNKQDDKQERVIPKLRFPEFQTALGWENKTLGSLGTFTGGGTPSKNNYNYWNGQNPWISSSDISDESIYTIRINRFISDLAIKESATKIVPKNSILLVSRVGVGKLAITKDLICTSQDFINITPSKDNLVFLAYALKAMKGKFLSLNQGMAIKGFTKDDLVNLEISLPSTPKEQQKIADCLSSIDELINLREQKLTVLKQHKKGLMQQLFPSHNELQASKQAIVYPKLRFPQFKDCKGWEVVKLGDICENLDARRIPITTQDRESGKIPYYGASGIIDYIDKFIFNEDLLCVSEDGANLIDRNYPIAFSISGETWVNNHAHVLRFKNRATQIIVEYYLNSINLEYYLTGMTQPKLNQAKLSTILIPKPSLEKEQQFIAYCLSSLDKLISDENEQIDRLKDHKKGLMQQLFPIY